jgi:hypothetical protein
MCLKSQVKLTQGQFDALVSFAYNVGSRALSTSTLIKLNAGDIKGAADEFLRWNKSGGKVMAGLTNRRKAEEHCFIMTAEAILTLVKKFWLPALIAVLIGAGYRCQSLQRQSRARRKGLMTQSAASTWQAPPSPTCRPGSAMLLHWMPNTRRNCPMRKNH